MSGVNGPFIFARPMGTVDALFDLRLLLRESSVPPPAPVTGGAR